MEIHNIRIFTNYIFIQKVLNKDKQEKGKIARIYTHRDSRIGLEKAFQIFLSVFKRRVSKMLMCSK